MVSFYSTKFFKGGNQKLFVYKKTEITSATTKTINNGAAVALFYIKKQTTH